MILQLHAYIQEAGRARTFRFLPCCCSSALRFLLARSKRSAFSFSNAASIATLCWFVRQLIGPSHGVIAIQGSHGTGSKASVSASRHPLMERVTRVILPGLPFGCYLVSWRYILTRTAPNGVVWLRFLLRILRRPRRCSSTTAGANRKPSSWQQRHLRAGLVLHAAASSCVHGRFRLLPVSSSPKERSN